MTDRGSSKERTAALKKLREERAETVNRTQALLKEQQAFRKRLRQAMKDGARTVPEIATAAGLPADQVLWNIAGMKKYDLVKEVGKEGDYYRYALTEETIS
jgi:predicted HTH transcriptional regulator